MKVLCRFLYGKLKHTVLAQEQADQEAFRRAQCVHACVQSPMHAFVFECRDESYA